MTDLSDGMQGRHLPTTNMADTLLAVEHALQPIHYSAIATATADTLLATATATATWLTLCLQC